MPTIEGIRLASGTPFRVFVYFWCSPHPSNCTAKQDWHCKYKDLVAQHGGDVKFYTKYDGSLQKLVSRAKLVLEIVHYRAREYCLSLDVFKDFFKLLGGEGHCSKDTYNTLLGYAECLDSEWERGGSSNWHTWVDTLRDQYLQTRKRPAAGPCSP